MKQRCIAFGDIHGCSAAFSTLIRAIDPQKGDMIVTLGDYVDRGIDSKGVIDQLIDLQTRCSLISLLGNHDAQMLAAMDDKREFRRWLDFGGISTLQSYGDSMNFASVPKRHVQLLRSLSRFHEIDTHFFVHANYREHETLQEQNDEVLFWRSLRDRIPGRHCSGKVAVLGHTPQDGGAILDLGYLVCIDTGCCYGGLLTAIDVMSHEVWQSEENGTLVTQQ